MNQQDYLQRAFLALWLALVIYSLTLAPSHPQDLAYTLSLLRFDNLGQNIVLFVVFSLMGLWPLVLAPLLLYSNHYKLRPWPFWLLSFGLGFFAIAPYVALRNRRKNTPPPNRPRIWQWWRIKMVSNAYAIVLASITCFLLLLTIVYRDLPDFIDLFKTYRFVHIMTLDFLALQLLAIYLIYQDFSSTEPSRPLIQKIPVPIKLIVFFVPVFGPAIYPLVKHSHASRSK